jgi:hypothetical protein
MAINKVTPKVDNLKNIPHLLKPPMIIISNKKTCKGHAAAQGGGVNALCAGSLDKSFYC